MAVVKSVLKSHQNKNEGLNKDIKEGIKHIEKGLEQISNDYSMFFSLKHSDDKSFIIGSYYYYDMEKSEMIEYQCDIFNFKEFTKDYLTLRHNKNKKLDESKLEGVSKDILKKREKMKENNFNNFDVSNIIEKKRISVSYDTLIQHRENHLNNLIVQAVGLIFMEYGFSYEKIISHYESFKNDNFNEEYINPNIYFEIRNKMLKMDSLKEMGDYFKENMMMN